MFTLYDRDVIGPIFGCVPVYTEVELKTAFRPVNGVVRIFAEERFRIDQGLTYLICHSEKENSSVLRRESNSDR